MSGFDIRRASKIVDVVKYSNETQTKEVVYKYVEGQNSEIFLPRHSMPKSEVAIGKQENTLEGFVVVAAGLAEEAAFSQSHFAKTYSNAGGGNHSNRIYSLNGPEESMEIAESEDEYKEEGDEEEKENFDFIPRKGTIS